MQNENSKQRCAKLRRMKKVNLKQKFAAFTDHWRPKIVGELNGQEVRVVKLKGDLSVASS